MFKRLTNTEGKNEEQLKVLKDQLEKQLIINKVKNPNFNNVSFRNLLGDKSKEVFNKIKGQDTLMDYSRLNFIGSSKKYIFKFRDFMSLRNFTENIYNDNVSLNVAKQEQKKLKICLKVLLNKIRLRMCIKIKKEIFF